ncbi:hypothetical protein DVH24_031373 [Malus domestica]|uniref:ABC-2 type transporter domain-containing protein n=1 Tax=Malus domestica TaxID=3750 RepID=A0A498HE29_MALDO|nr:hypothetical protein DVH24_031373 [Malus domestica]
MDTRNHIYEASQSFRANSSSVWRDTGMEVFSRPSMTSNHEDEEEDLKWAALERLPTFNRLKKGLLTSSSGEASEVDVRKLGFQERNNLIQRLVKDTETQNEKFLMRLRERLDRREKAANIQPDPDIDVFMKLIVMAFITMTLFIRTRMHRDSITDGGIFTGALFFCMIMVMFNGMSELSLTIAKLSVFYKQRDLMFFPAWAYALPGWLIKVPLSFVEVAIWVFMTYYVIGFDPNVHRLFRQYFIFILVHQMASGLFRLIAALGRNMVIATTGGSFALLVLFVNGGFVLSRVDIKKWWIWAYWISPMMYAQNAVEVNEFLGNSWKHVLPNTEQPLGILVLKSRGFFTEQRWYWIGVGGLIGFIILFNLAYVLALTYLDSYDKAQSISWTLYGLVISQYGDMDDMLDNGVTVKQFLKSYFGFEHKFLGPVAGIVTAFVILFGLIFAVSIKVFNFQKR